MAHSILMVAGEASADVHGHSVMAALRAAQPELALFGVGGRQMRAAGFDACIAAESMAVAGITEVFSALPRLVRNLRLLERLAAERRPQAALLIDMPDFNLRLARRLRRLGIPVIYYISPQIWAWRPKRVAQIRAYVDRMLVILPFEQAFYRRHGVPVRFVGHPLLEQLPPAEHIATPGPARSALALPAAGPYVALLPGSRHKEVARHLPDMLAALRRLRQTYPQLRALLPVASTVSVAQIEAILQRSGADVPVHVLDGQADLALCAADAAVVCSGTATLQAALLQRPMVVVYRVSWLTYQLLRRLIRVPHIALVNLVAQKRLVPELIQTHFTVARLHSTLAGLLGRPSAPLRHEFAALRASLHGGDTAAAVAAEVLAYTRPRPAA